MHEVLSAILRTAFKWGHLSDNPARGVDLPTLKTVKPKGPHNDASLGNARCVAAPRADDGRVALLTGLRRGEIFALRSKSAQS